MKLRHPGNPEKPPPAGPGEVRTPSEHYRRGNRLFEQKNWEQARREWRRAAALWRPSGVARVLRDRLAGLRAVLLFLATVMEAYYLNFTYFTRDPFDLLMSGMTFEAPEERSWWQRFLDTGRPGGNDGHKLGVREWWDSLREGMGGEEEQAEQRERFRPSIDERWAELLRRYNRWGPLIGRDLDHHVVAAQGLVTQGAFAEAIEILERGIAKTSDGGRLGELYQSLATTYYFQGYTLQMDQLATYDLELVRHSAEAYEQSLRYQPRVLSYGNLGWAYYLLGQYDLAERNSMKALSYDESLEYVRLNLGLIYLVQDMYKASFSSYRRVARQRPPPDAFLGGISDLQEVLRDEPGRYPFAHLMSAYLNIHRGDLPEARRHLAKFLAAPDIGGPWRGVALDWRRDFSTARNY